MIIFNFVSMNGEIPVWEGVCLATAYDVTTLNDIERGLMHKDYADIVKFAKRYVSMYDANMATKGKIPAQVYMFRSKNYYGMKDVQDVNVVPVNTTTPKNVEEIIDQLPDQLPEGEEN